MAQLGTTVRTTQPLALEGLAQIDSGRYHSAWLPDHMVSLWPDALWTPEFTDLATVTPTPHRHFDAMAVAAAVAVSTSRVKIATSVVDTVRRHPAMLAQTALTLDHLSRGRFILGLGAGELENVVPYGFDFARPVSRCEEAVRVIRMLWEADGPVDFEGRFYHLEHAQLAATPYGDKPPEIWVGGSGPRMLNIAGTYADGWWPIGSFTPESYAPKLAAVREAADRAGRDPEGLATPAFLICLIGEDDEVVEIARSPLVQAYLLQVSGSYLEERGFTHPFGPSWRGIHDIDPGSLTRSRLLEFLAGVSPEAVLAVMPHGTPTAVAEICKGYVDAGVSIPRVLDYSGMAGLEFGSRSPTKVAETEDRLVRLMGA